MRCWCQRPTAACRKRYALLILEAPEPDDIMWENLEFTWLQRFGLRAIITVATYLLILIGTCPFWHPEMSRLL